MTIVSRNGTSARPYDSRTQQIRITPHLLPICFAFARAAKQKVQERIFSRQNINFDSYLSPGVATREPKIPFNVSGFYYAHMANAYCKSNAVENFSRSFFRLCNKFGQHNMHAQICIKANRKEREDWCRCLLHNMPSPYVQEVTKN